MAAFANYAITRPTEYQMDEGIKLKHEPKANLTNKQRKARAAAKRARKARKINRRK